MKRIVRVISGLEMAQAEWKLSEDKTPQLLVDTIRVFTEVRGSLKERQLYPLEKVELSLLFTDMIVLQMRQDG